MYARVDLPASQHRSTGASVQWGQDETIDQTQDSAGPTGEQRFETRHELGWDVLHVIEHDDLRRASDYRHYELARQLQRTLITIDRDYLDDRRFPPAESSGVIVVWAPNEALLAGTMAELDRRVFHARESGPRPRLPLEGRKLVADPSWMRA